MSEGLFSPARLPIPGVPVDRLSATLVRVLPTTRLRLSLADSREAAFAAARNETLADGTEVWHRAFTHEDLARADDPVFAMAMVQHEFALAVRAGARLPVELPLVGGGGEHDSFVSDHDGSMGSSGSPVFDTQSGVIGVFSRVAGNGPRNAFEYGGTPRVHVGVRSVVTAMGRAATDSEG
ncbi:hypothetical protein [Rubrivivax gelatinosus]|uniref:Serine protease n=1 Tax=Rubrivivax gelatinosus TaxID=28068 RepID=A0A4R2MB32_RUBGE|nr:hypothetical protein [Rubrivivax gelatinosus]MBK1690201.1 hypothetical protein [Rubrivivax gelatinosus]TCP03471.1 hypothetical protein EV684_104192 [Rubrivivax gelatinosus]